MKSFQFVCTTERPKPGFLEHFYSQYSYSYHLLTEHCVKKIPSHKFVKNIIDFKFADHKTNVAFVTVKTKRNICYRNMKFFKKYAKVMQAHYDIQANRYVSFLEQHFK